MAVRAGERSVMGRRSLRFQKVRAGLPRFGETLYSRAFGQGGIDWLSGLVRWLHAVLTLLSRVDVNCFSALWHERKARPETPADRARPRFVQVFNSTTEFGGRAIVELAKHVVWMLSALMRALRINFTMQGRDFPARAAAR